MNLFPRPVLPVLMYHRFGSEPAGDPHLWISLDRFAAQLRWLRDHRFRTLSLDEAYQSLKRGRVPRRAVLITIDDGFSTDLEQAGEVLERQGALAAVFVPAGLLGQEIELGHPDGDTRKSTTGTLVDGQGLRRWVERGFDVGCHSLTHRDLTTLDADSLRQETADARQLLANSLERPIHDFCYPFAHHDLASRRAVADAGFRSAYAGEPPKNDLFAVPRMMIYPDDSEARFRRKVSGYYFWVSALHQKLRRFVGN